MIKVLISNDNYSAHYYIRLGLARAFSALGCEVAFWQTDKVHVHDVFDKFEPHIFLGQTYNIDEQLFNAICERPHLKSVMKAADWGAISDTIDREKYPVLIATQKEIDTVLRLKERTNNPTYLEIHYHEDAVSDTHGHWIKAGVPVYSQLSAADLFVYYGGIHKKEFASDITFVGGYWPYKAQILDSYLLRLCDKTKYNIKIFGNSTWPVHQYCGFVDDNNVKNALASAKICLNLHEPHSHTYGYDVVERPFKLCSNRCFVISDDVSGLRKLYNDNEMVFASSPEDMESKIDYYLSNREKRVSIAEAGFNKTLRNHTYFHRAADILRRLGYEEFAGDALEKVMKKYI